MLNVKELMFAASAIGILAGILYTVQVNPLNNYYIFMVLFMMVAVGIANVALFVGLKLYKWLKQYYSDPERIRNANTA
jgi:vacuolar-type H+-ATPase subunit I/STV1